MAGLGSASAVFGLAASALLCPLGLSSCGSDSGASASTPADGATGGATQPLPDGAVGNGDGSGSSSETGAKPRDGSTTAPDGAPLADPLGTLSGDLRVNNFGWRAADHKLAVLLGHAGASVELRRATDNTIAATYTASAAATEGAYSGDSYATVEFTAFNTPGDYYLYLPAEKLHSYTFALSDRVYDIVGAAAAKSYYYQRCNHDKALPFASDALGGLPGAGGKWVDGVCHGGDSNAAAGPGSTDNGRLDVHGGWHDAGDYQKTLWGRGVPEMLFAYEVNPSVWGDGQLNIPESGNGIADLLDEVKWELDFYLRMQRPDGHFMSSAKGHGGTKASPPSQSDEERVYFDCTSPDGNGWSGGGVTLVAATENAVLSLAHAAIVFRAAGQGPIGDGYAAAATRGWAWLDGQAVTGDARRSKASAASAVYRMDAQNASAKAFADAFPWDTWDGLLPYSVTPGENAIAPGAFHYLMNTKGTASVAAKVRTGVGKALVDTAFTADGPYGGLFGNAGNGWDWSWGSNRSQATYGFNLLMAAKTGALGAHTAADIAVLAQKHLHFLLGLNPLNMLYMTNMAAYGGEHSSFQIYHSWFSYTAGDGDHGNVQYNGKPSWVTEPLYPYYVDDKQTSEFGPPPGIMPGGPNMGYSGAYTIPKKNWPAYAYRDFSVGCDWDGARCRASSWEISEPMQAYQGPLVGLLSFFMSAR